jgi:hypothetical protein
VKVKSSCSYRDTSRSELQPLRFNSPRAVKDENGGKTEGERVAVTEIQLRQCFQEQQTRYILGEVQPLRVMLSSEVKDDNGAGCTR